MSLYLVSKLDSFGNSSPVAVAHTLPEADALVESLSAALPKGELAWFSREKVEGGVVKPTPFTVKTLAADMANFE